MQPDYPLYEEMVRRGSRGRWFWRAGTWLYAAGLLGIVVVLAVWPVVFFFKFGKTSLVYPVLLLVMAGLVVLGSALRKLSYRIALGEGIDIVKYIEQPPEVKR